MENDSNSLLALLRQSFNEEEIRQLCFEIGVDFEELPAGLGRSGKLVELIKLCARRNKLVALVTYCRKQRDTLPWPDPRFLNVDVLLGKPVKPPQPFEPETVLIAAGAFIMGSKAGEGAAAHEMPQHELTLPDFTIGRFPVTNEEYAAFVKLGKGPSPDGWLGVKPPRGKARHPVVNVTWLDAAAYCRWLAEHTGRPYRLPTEAEWEKAARGSDGRLYPWGDEWGADRCNHNRKGTTAIDAFPSGASPYGCQDMVGNVREWTSTIWGDDYQTSQYHYPYRIDDGREDRGEDTNIFRVIRGSSFRDELGRHRCAARAWYAPDNRDRRRGFRVVMAKLDIRF